MHSEFWWGNLREKDHFEDLGIDGRIILKRALQEVGRGPWAELSAALVIQHAMRMRRVLVSSVTFPVVHNFSTLSHEPHDYRQKVTKHKMCDLIFSSNLSETFFILRKRERDMVKNVH